MKTKLLLLLDEFSNYRKKFFEKVKQEGFDESVAERWWQIISGQASYSFAKSHSYPYSKLTYLTMYLKAKYPKQFILALLNNTARAKEDKDGLNEISKIIFSAKRDYGVPIYPPHFNKSAVEFTSEGAGIRFGLNAVKDIGKSAEAIVGHRPYSDFDDFLIKTEPVKSINKRAIMALIFSGAFDTVNKDKNALIAHYKQKKKGGDEKQTTFIDIEVLKDDVGKKSVERYDSLEFIQKEIEYINMTFKDIGGSEEFPSLSRADSSNSPVKFSAYVETIKERVSKNGNNYILLRLTDFNDHMSVMCFNKTRDNLVENEVRKGSLVRAIVNKASGDGNMYFADTVKIVENTD